MISGSHQKEATDGQSTINHQMFDNFIQSCLDKYFFVEPWKELYDNVGIFSQHVISNKSTIPDLIIYNKTFNKNECFEGANKYKLNKFPRVRFILRPKNKNTYNPKDTFCNEKIIIHNKEEGNNFNQKNNITNNEVKGNDDLIQYKEYVLVDSNNKGSDELFEKLESFLNVNNNNTKNNKKIIKEESFDPNYFFEKFGSESEVSKSIIQKEELPTIHNINQNKMFNLNQHNENDNEPIIKQNNNNNTTVNSFQQINPNSRYQQILSSQFIQKQMQLKQLYQLQQQYKNNIFPMNQNIKMGIYPNPNVTNFHSDMKKDDSINQYKQNQIKNNNDDISELFGTEKDEDKDDDPMMNDFKTNYSAVNPLVFLENPALIIKKNIVDPKWIIMKENEIIGNYNSEELLFFLNEKSKEKNYLESIWINDYHTDLVFKPKNLHEILKEKVPGLKRKYLKAKMGLNTSKNAI